MSGQAAPTTCVMPPCPRQGGATYQWRDAGAPAQLLVIVAVAFLFACYVLATTQRIAVLERRLRGFEREDV
jgi:hypothetical protein